MTIEKNTFGEIISGARKKKGLSLRELSRRIDVSHPYLSQLENGHNNNPSPSIVLKLSDELGISFIYLASLTDTDIGLSKPIPEHYISFLKNIDFHVLENIHTFEDFLEWAKNEDDYKNNSNKYSEDLLRRLYNSIQEVRELENRTRALAKLADIKSNLIEIVEEDTSKIPTLQQILKTGFPISLNGKRLSDSDLDKIIKIAEIVIEE